MSTSHERITTRDAPLPKAGKLRLLVLGHPRVVEHWLPAAGAVIIGRGGECDVRIDDPSISRQHAVLHLGPPLAIEDAGSSNGTRVRDATLRPGEPQPIAVGEGFVLGTTMLVVQELPADRPPRTLWAPAWFEARLAEELARARRTGGRHCVLRVRGDDEVAPERLEAALASAVRASDVIGRQEDRRLDVLLVQTEAATADAVAARVRAALARAGQGVQIEIVALPAADASPPDAAADRALGVTQPTAWHRRGSGPISLADLQPTIALVAATTINVLIEGETGAGKEFMAEQIHRLSPRAARPLLRLNCAALAATLIESELFGHERGAFTGAVRAKPGLLVTAEGGSVFLDEIGELPLELQAKLLRVLDERKVMPVGSVQAVPIDVRFIAATNRTLEAEVARGTFRQDLYFRLNGFALVVPPLRERPEEIAGLATAFAARAGHSFGFPQAPTISAAAMERLVRYRWPGNIRELRNAIERAVVLSAGLVIEPKHLVAELAGAEARGGAAEPPARPTADARREGPPPADPTLVAPPAAATPPVADDERQRILAALERAAGNQTVAAKLLGVSRRTLVTKLTWHGIPRPRKGRARADR